MAEISRPYRETPVIPRSIWSPMYTLISLMMIAEKMRLFEQAFYEKKNLDSSMYANVAGKTVELPINVDAELLAKVLSNPEMAALLSTLAKSLESK